MKFFNDVFLRYKFSSGYEPSRLSRCKKAHEKGEKRKKRTELGYFIGKQSNIIELKLKLQRARKEGKRNF